MRLSRSLAALGVLAAASWFGCDGGSLTPHGGPGTAGSGAGGEGEDLLLSDFEDGLIATVAQTNGRNGYWYTHNDGTELCDQRPPTSLVYAGVPPPTQHPGSTGSLALHANWQSCNMWGARIAADFAVPFTSAITYTGPKVAYDVGRFKGVTFWARTMPLSELLVHVRFPMRATTRVQDGGLCDESVVGVGLCGDEWREPILLPGDGTWKQFIVRFSDAAFAQSGWGVAAPWNPADVFGIEFQSSGAGDLYDFWIDDIYFIQ